MGNWCSRKKSKFHIAEFHKEFSSRYFHLMHENHYDSCKCYITNGLYNGELSIVYCHHTNFPVYGNSRKAHTHVTTCTQWFNIPINFSSGAPLYHLTSCGCVVCSNRFSPVNPLHGIYRVSLSCDTNHLIHQYLLLLS